MHTTVDLHHKPEKNQANKVKKITGVQDLKFFQGLKQTVISQDIDFQKSRCRLKGRLNNLLQIKCQESPQPCRLYCTEQKSAFTPFSCELLI